MSSPLCISVKLPVLVVVAAVACLLPATLPATASAELKIGVVITQRLLAESTIGSQAAERLQVKKTAAQEKLDAKAKEILFGQTGAAKS